MPYFITEEPLHINGVFTLSGDEARHLLLSHRIKIGEKVKIQDSNLNRFLCEVLSNNKKSLELKTINQLSIPPEPTVKISVCISNISEQALDIILTKSTELGADSILIFQAENSPGNLQTKAPTKIDRWNRICIEATKQCERASAPKVEILKNLEDALRATEKYENRYFLEFNAKDLKKETTASKGPLALFVGPEGGWSASEVKLAKKHKLELVTLGPRVLKAETASIAGLAILQLKFGDL